MKRERCAVPHPILPEITCQLVAGHLGTKHTHDDGFGRRQLWDDRMFQHLVVADE